MEDRRVRWIDLLRLPLASLGQQKMRTCLTTLGVVFGAFVLAASLSIDEGVQRTIERESSKGDVARKVTVFPRWRAAEPKAADDVKVAGRMSPDRRERIRKSASVPDRGPGSEQVQLTPDRLEKPGANPHVGRMIPIVRRRVATLGNRPEDGERSVRAGEDPEFRKRVVVGRSFDSDDGDQSFLRDVRAPGSG
jgi:putative ABC transport system permease protein